MVMCQIFDWDLVLRTVQLKTAVVSNTKHCNMIAAIPKPVYTRSNIYIYRVYTSVVLYIKRLCTCTRIFIPKEIFLGTLFRSDGANLGQQACHLAQLFACFKVVWPNLAEQICFGSSWLLLLFSCAGQVYKKVMAGERPRNLLRIKDPNSCTMSLCHVEPSTRVGFFLNGFAKLSLSNIQLLHQDELLRGIVMQCSRMVGSSVLVVVWCMISADCLSVVQRVAVSPSYSCTEKPEERPSASQLLAHSWLKEDENAGRLKYPVPLTTWFLLVSVWMAGKVLETLVVYLDSIL